MNSLQQKETGLLKSFVEICDQLNLNYFLVCGTALGAVKYGGFIPWDDDVDVALPRGDYKIFCEKAQQLLPEGLFLQTYETDEKYPCIFGKIRDSRTTYIEKTYAKIPMNHGVYIDVFPLDGYPEDPKAQKKLERGKLFCKLLVSCVYESDCSLKVKFLRKIFRICGVHKHTDKVLARYERLISAYPTENSRLWCNHGNWQGRQEYAARGQYGKGAKMLFEGIPVRVPEQYDLYLTQKYGDWRGDPPEADQVGHHFYTVLDLEKPYTKYTAQ